MVKLIGIISILSILPQSKIKEKYFKRKKAIIIPSLNNMSISHLGIRVPDVFWWIERGCLIDVLIHIVEIGKDSSPSDKSE